jgi:YtcA family
MKDRIYFPQRRQGAKKKFFELCVFASWRENLRIRNSGTIRVSSHKPNVQPSKGWLFYGVSIAAIVFVAAGCDPVVNIGGTFFPGWMVSILIGSALSVAIRYLFVFIGLEPHVGPLALIYTSLGVLLSVVSWLILYRS